MGKSLNWGVYRVIQDLFGEYIEGYIGLCRGFYIHAFFFKNSSASEAKAPLALATLTKPLQALVLTPPVRAGSGTSSKSGTQDAWVA